MKIGQAVAGLLIMGLIAGGLFLYPDYTTNNGEKPVSVYSGQGKSLGKLEVPVIGMGIQSVGTLHIELEYDPEMLRVTSVKEGSLTNNADVCYSSEIPGRVIVGIVDSEGLKGQGSLMVVQFDVLVETDMTTPLKLENIKAWDVLNISRIFPTSIEGSFRSSDRALAPPLLVFPQ